MFVLRPPSDERVRGMLARVATAETTCEHPGVTRGSLDAAPAGYTLDAYAVELGRGAAVFEGARAAIAGFEHYPASFSRVVPFEGALREGLVFGTVATHFGFASVHPCRVAFVLDEVSEDGARRFGFGLVTLPGHIARGEECFSVAIEGPEERVRLEVRAISRPADLLAWIGRPVLRAFQARFRRELVSGMRARVTGLASTDDDSR